jgi:hypothetical protein
VCPVKWKKGGKGMLLLFQRCGAFIEYRDKYREAEVRKI